MMPKSKHAYFSSNDDKSHLKSILTEGLLGL